jgi:hypothetical protein
MQRKRIMWQTLARRTSALSCRAEIRAGLAPLPREHDAMTNDIIRVSDSFWNLRGSFKIGGILDVGTHTSLVRRANGRFLLLDAYTLSDSVRREINARTRDGQDVEAILNLHPFHTIHVRAMHRAFPSARLYGTTRHRAKLPDLPWEPTLSEDPATHALFAEDLEFFVPRGVDFVSPDERVHLSSVLVLHRASRTLHVDDTFTYLPVPWPIRLLAPVGLLRIHPTLPKALERRAGAARDFRRWVEELAERCRDAQNLCAAHTAALTPAAPGTSISALLRKALTKAERTLRAHELRYG